MPRPNAAHLALGSAAVVCSTIALLLLTGTTSGAGIALVVPVSLALGLATTLAAARGSAGRSADGQGAGGRGVRASAGPAFGPRAEPRGRAGAGTPGDRRP
ncbi:hypothetical protein [Streptomyces fradiae]|uniref:hypothetical protein n=1 Tax=Streptomyces fradiae TaxID=1906 RepID=UPI0035BE2303